MSVISKQRKILFLAAWYPSEVNSFAGNFIREHAKAAAIDNDVCVVYASPDPSPPSKGFLRITDEVEGNLRTVRVKYGGWIFHYWRKFRKQSPSAGTPQEPPAPSGNLLRSLFRLPFALLEEVFYFLAVFFGFRELRKTGWHPDIIHVNVFTSGIPAVIIGKVYRIPVVVTEHMTKIATHSLSFFERLKLRFTYKRARYILPVSDDLRNSIRNFYGVKTASVTVPNVVDTHVYQPSEASPVPGHKPVRMLMVGFLTPRKGIPYLLEALSIIKERRTDFTLDIVGDGPNRQEYEAMSVKLGLNDIVTFHGQQPEVVSFMQGCDFFVLPSLYENFGVVYAEAMACGKPVIGTNAGGPAEFINDTVGMLVPPEDVPSLVQAIEKMLDTYQDYPADYVAQYIRDRYSVEAIGRQFGVVYDEISSEIFNRKKEKGKWQAGLSEKTITIDKNWLVLDVGSGHNPHPRADILADFEINSSIHRSGKSAKLDNVRPFVIADATYLPFKDKSFDFVIASHIAEHIEDPGRFCTELTRVSKRGYIETPSKLSERLLDEPFHINLISKSRSGLVFEKKREKGSDWFYRLFYYGRQREGHADSTVSNPILDLACRSINFLILRIWQSYPVKSIMYIRFKWNDTFTCKIKQ